MYIFIFLAKPQNSEKEISYLAVKCDSGVAFSLLIVRYDTVFDGTIMGIFDSNLVKGLLLI
jgi:hypothetical protein